MNKPYLSDINGEICPEFYPSSMMPSISMREIYSTCKNCINYKKCNCLKNARPYITMIIRN